MKKRGKKKIVRRGRKAQRRVSRPRRIKVRRGARPGAKRVSRPRRIKARRGARRVSRPRRIKAKRGAKRGSRRGKKSRPRIRRAKKVALPKQALITEPPDDLIDDGDDWDDQEEIY